MNRTTPPGFRRLPRIADQLTAAHLDLVDQSFAAERSGDAAGALALHSSVPAFALRSRHHLLLEQLAALGDELPGWVWARWMAYQAVRCEDQDTETGRMQRLALRYALETFHVDQLTDCHADGGDPVKVASWVASESWLFHQLCLYELGGLTRFSDELATGRLAEHVRLARSWASSPLGGYRIETRLSGGRLSVHDPGADSWVDVLDLGAGAGVDGGGWVLGRLVPSGIGELPMFDMPPIAVPERVARDVSRAPEPWKVISAALDEGRLVESTFMRADYELVTDVPSIDLLRVGTPPADLERITAQLRAGRDEIPRAAFRILRGALDGGLTEAEAAHVAAAVLQPAARDDAMRMLVRQGQRDVWAHWAGLVHEPAQRLLLAFADASRSAA